VLINLDNLTSEKKVDNTASTLIPSKNPFGTATSVPGSFFNSQPSGKSFQWHTSNQPQIKPQTKTLNELMSQGSGFDLQSSGNFSSGTSSFNQGYVTVASNPFSQPQATSSHQYNSNNSGVPFGAPQNFNNGATFGQTKQSSFF
jgi:hypothetical protein